jgi:hypothetical protein
MALFRRFKQFLIGNTDVDVYQGNKGGYSYLIFYDKTNKEVISHYVSPPAKESKSVQTKANTGLFGGIAGEVNYQSEITYKDPFVVMNKNKKSQLTESDLTSKLNDLRTQEGQSKITPIKSYELEQEKSYIAGPYMVPVSPDNIENPSFQSHFDELSEYIKDSLGIFLEFILQNFWENKEIYRASVYLYDANSKELKMRIGNNMTPYSDYMIGFKSSTWPIWTSFKEKRDKIFDFAIKTRDEYVDVESLPKVWADMQSLIAVPILDGDNTALGVLTVDSNNDYVEAKFKDVKPLLMMLTRGMGRLLEGNSV